MDDDLSQFLDLDLPGYEYCWTYAICLHTVLSGVILQFQYLEFFDDPVFFDLDNKAWCRCYKCKHSFHVDCIGCTINPKERNSIFRITGPFACCL